MFRRMAVVIVSCVAAMGNGGAAVAGDAPTTVPLITSPAEGTVVTGNIAVTATSTAPLVKFILDSPFSTETPVVADVVGGVATASIPTAGYYGWYFLTARDCADNDTCNVDASSVKVNVDNPPPTITSPSPNEVFNYWKPVALAATVDSGAVQFFRPVGGPPIVDLVAPFEVSLDVTTWPAGGYRLSTITCDEKGAVCEGAQSDVWISVVGLGLELSPPATKFLSPNGDGVQDSVLLEFSTTRTTDLTYLVRNAQDENVGAGTLGVGVAAGDHQATFAGEAGGTRLPDGRYTFIIRATNSVHPGRTEEVSAEFVVDRSAPDFRRTGQSSARLYPHGDDYLDFVDLWARSADRGVVQELDIRDDRGATVMHRTFEIQDPSTVEVRWRGIGDDGEPVTPGPYRVRWKLTDKAGNTSMHGADLLVSDKQLVHQKVPLTVDARDAYRWKVGRCSVVRPHHGDRRARDYLSDEKCDSRPYDTNRRHIIIGFYSVRVPKAVSYDRARFWLVGGALKKRSIAWESIWLAEQDRWRAARYARPRMGRHSIDYRSVRSVDEHGRIYMAVIVGGGGRYKLDRLVVNVECSRLVSPTTTRW